MNRQRSIVAEVGTVLGLALLVASAACLSQGPEPEASASTGNAPSVALPDWCAGHGLPESMCTKCNPALVAGFKASGDWCAGHGFPESVCPLCNPQSPPEKVQAAAPTAAEAASIVPGTRIRFRSPEIERASGIETERARSTTFGVGVECTARIVFDRNRLADIRASMPGVVRDVKVDLGERVSEGSTLFVLESVELAELQGRHGAAHERLEVAQSNYERQMELRKPKIASARQVEQAREALETAQAELRSIETRLRIAGADEWDLEGRFEVRSPIVGTVVRRPATIGTFATNEISLATVADTTSMWAWLEVREADAASLRIGQPVTIEVEALPGHEFAGRVTWISAEVDPRTRTVGARAEVANPRGLLRAEQFARATIEVDAAEDVLVVPRRAIQRLGEESVVFVRTGDSEYEPRVVTVGRSTPEVAEIRGALRQGDPVATSGAFLLKTELSRENIGSGCCEVSPPSGS